MRTGIISEERQYSERESNAPVKHQYAAARVSAGDERP